MDLTEFVCIVDRSGSMSAVIDDAIGGFNTFLADQQKNDGKAIMSIAMFDDQYEMRYNGEDLKNVKPFNHTTYVPRGMTALFDAIGKTMNAVNERVDKAVDSEKIPKKILYAILTDGHENSSHEFTKDQVLKMIENEKKKGREVIFLGADASAFDPEMRATVGSSNILHFAPTGAGVQAAYHGMSSACMSYSSTGSLGNWGGGNSPTTDGSNNPLGPWKLPDHKKKQHKRGSYYR